MNVALRPEHLNLLSICTGGAGLDLGIELAIPSARSVCMVEREAFAVATLVSAMEQGLLHPAPVWSDARTFNGRAWRGAVDGLIGGIPCQPHSLAGRKQGSNDARDLWSTARRIIVQSGAWFVVIENVGGMLAAGADEIAGAQRVFRDLHKLGFETEGGLFTAAEVGASHQRERIFILAVADPGRRQLRRRARSCSILPETGGSEGKGHQRERDGNASSGGSGSLADTDCFGQRGEGDGGIKARIMSSARGATVDDASIARGGRIPVQPRRQDETGADFNRPGLFPPGPDQRGEWINVLQRSPELEPAFRRMADGMATGVDLAQCWSRTERLRQLGNGVVSLEAAYAIRTLVTRLAARGSAGAARLVRMMEGTEA